MCRRTHGETGSGRADDRAAVDPAGAGQAAPAVRTLLVAAEYPWPVNSGSRLRLLGTLRALQQCGPVDLLSIVSDQRRDFEPPPPEIGLERIERVAIDDRPPSSWRWAAALARRSVPYDLPVAPRTVVGPALRRFATGAYDCTWFFRVRAWTLAQPFDGSRAVVDLDDLEDQKILARLASLPPAPSAPVAARRAATSALSRENARRWRALHGRIAAACAATVVCSDLDRDRLGLPGVAVVPNGYDAPDRPLGRLAVGDPGTVLFQGTLRYGPNADGARFLARQVAPRLVARRPGTRIRLVGRASPDVADLADTAGVSVVGPVPDIADELAAADVVAVPLRFGSGTRIKILEAFAHRIPVVSTTLGAEGLDVVDGVHLLVADDPDDFAAACAELLRDESRRAALADAAERLFLDRYRSDRAFSAASELARKVAGR